MSSPGSDERILTPRELRARAWRDGAHLAICDAIEPWAHGTVVRATRYPHYYDFNVMHVEDHPGLGVAELTSVADAALDGLEHRRLDFDLISAAEPLRAEFEAAGWSATRILWMRHEGDPPSGAKERVETVPYDTAHPLRVRWHEDDLGGRAVDAYQAQAREVALRRGVRVLLMRERGEPVAFAQLERDGAAAEITQVYVHPDHRGHGRGSALTRAAIESAGELEDLWICADDEDRPKELYARLGFRPAWTTMQFLRLPNAGPRAGAG